IEALQWSINEMSRRHETLRTSFVPSISFGALRANTWESAGQLPLSNMPNIAVQFRSRIHSQIAITVPFVDISSLSHYDQSKELDLQLASIAQLSGTYAVAPLMRLLLLKLGIREHVLMIGVSHLISDGWSSSLLKSEVERLYHSRITKT